MEADTLIAQKVDQDSNLEALRSIIDQLDADIISYFASRMQVSEHIGQLKKERGIQPLQVNRWQEVMSDRMNLGRSMGLSENFLTNLMNLIHEESLRKQNH